MLTEPAIAVQTEAVVGGKPTAPVSVFSLIAPGMSVAFAFWVAGEVAQTMHREKDEGTLRRLLSAPVSRLEIIAGYILAYTAVVFLQVVVLFAAAGVIFGMPLGESPAGIILVAVALGMTVSAFGLMMGSPARSGKQADSIVFVLGFILGGLSGALIMTWPPFYRAEGFMGTLARLTPHGPALEGYTRLLVERGGSRTCWCRSAYCCCTRWSTAPSPRTGSGGGGGGGAIREPSRSPDLRRPRLLFLDEPTVGANPQSRHHIFDSVLRLNRERGMSIIYATH